MARSRTSFIPDGQLSQVAIPRVPTAERRPLWSVMIPTYNCADYLRKALGSVLRQDPGSELMQIEVVDDGSTEDDPARVVKNLGHGRVRFYQQPTNVGHVRNFNTCLHRARGQLVHLLHGDDCVRDGFYRKMQQAFMEAPDIGAAFCRYISIDELGHWHTVSRLEQPHSGRLDNWLEKIAVGQRLQTPCMVIRRKVYEHLGGFDRRITCYAEDWEMWVRIAAHYPVWYEVEPLALYRVHSDSLTGQSERTGQNAADYRLAIEINRQHLPPDQADALSDEARRSFALACIRRARRKLYADDKGGAFVLVREGLKTHHSPIIWLRALSLLPTYVRRIITARLVSERQGIH